jgi:hypothetical protein
MKRLGIFTIAVVLIIGIVGCVGGDGNGGDGPYTLIVDFTDRGAVTVDDVPIPGKAILTYDAGTVVSLNATPDSDYQFVRWTGDVYTVDNVHASETIITVNADYSITANFEMIPVVQYSLNIIGPAHGSVTTPGEGRFLYEEGTVVNLVAKPASDYEFAYWTGDVDTIADVNDAITTITMNGAYYICAHFREIPTVCYANW